MSWREYVRDVEPYVAGEQPKIVDLIKLNTNENPYGPSPLVRNVLEQYNEERLKYYPNSDGEELCKSIAQYYGIDQQQVFLGNGSDEVLALSFLTFFNGKKPILFPEITYSFYPVYCELYKIPFTTIPMQDDFLLSKEAFFKENNGIIFPNPNAPTGLLVDLQFIEEVVCYNKESLVIIDEAYIDFGGVSALPLLEKYENILIIQTFSKSRSLAGARLGFAMGSKEVIAKLYDVKNSFNSYPIDSISQTIGKVCMEDQNYFKECTNKIISSREYTCQELKKLGFIVPDSYANFVFVKHPDYSGKELYDYLRENKILVRHWNKEKISDYLRITIGTQTDMETMLECLKRKLL
ncbi:histidinol-phosphate transaminase [Tannockella kyphosi]|uniref:histidinol-phosphate transaminase n=1 Tax=Tannockella kyphosi TaxID=2899121 RepID=UPI0020123F83|nr:histidinol-phosphate transaminase [Tannockella kyphosi]